MKKIIHVLTDTNVGGAGIWLLNFARAYNPEKYDCTAILPEKSLLTKRLTDLGFRVIEIPRIADKSFSVGGIREFKKCFKSEKPDIVHTHASLSARIAAKQCGIPVVSTRHCIEAPKTGIKRLIYGYINNSLSDIFIGVSLATCENLHKDGIRKDKLKLVYNGVFPLEKYTPEKKSEIKKRYGIPENNVVVGIIARLEPVKNHKLFLDMASIVSREREDISFIIVGGGSLEKELKDYCKELGLENKVIFTGYKSDITPEMNIIDINTLTSQNEALSISLIEGMSIDIPAVATNSGGPAEVIENEKSGFVVANYDKSELARAVIRLANDSELRYIMGSEGKRRAKAVFSVEAMMEKLEDIYDGLK